DDGGAQVVAQAAGELERRGAAVEDDDLAVAGERRGPSGDRRLRLGRAVGALAERAGVAGPGQRAAVDAAQQAGLVELAQVASDRVRRDVELRAQVGGEDATLGAQALEDQLASL